MTIRRIAILAVALTALSACKAVTLQEATVTQPTFRHRSRGLGRPCDGRAPSERLPRPDTDDPSGGRGHQHQRPSRNAHRSQPAGDDQRPIRQQPVRSIPGSIWLPAAGQGGAFDDDIQTQLAVTLANITDDDLARPIVVYCVDANCWLSYNAALRLHALGYENLYWYRGGIAAWKAANLPTRMASR